MAQPHESGGALLEARDVVFEYASSDGVPGFALRIGSLMLARGEHAALVGPSGSGKTTLLRLLTGIVRAHSGSVRLDGEEVSSLSDAERRALRLRSVGMVFQHFALLDYLSALENILLPYRLTRALPGRDGARERAIGLAEQTGIGHVLRRRPGRLSQGERQRVAICRALVTGPSLLVCDEPTGNLDPARSDSTLDLILCEADRSGATVLMVTHDHRLLDRFDRVIEVDSLAPPPPPNPPTPATPTAPAGTGEARS